MAKVLRSWSVRSKLRMFLNDIRDSFKEAKIVNKVSF